MGISVAEYLAQKQACEVCDATGNHQHCVTNLLSRIDNCVFYNTFLYHRDTDSANDIVLLQELRFIINPDIVLYYYIKAEPIVKEINNKPNNRDIWLLIYQQYVKDIFTSLRTRDRDAVAAKIESMLTNLEQQYQ